MQQKGVEKVRQIVTIAVKQSELNGGDELLFAAPPRLPVRRFSLEEYHQLIEMGFFRDDERIELIEGILVPMPPMSSRQAACIRKLQNRFTVDLQGRVSVSIQLPLAIPGRTSEPEPDIALLKLDPGNYSERHPRPSDVLLALEVSYSTLAYDDGDKRRLYARAGIQEYWIVNLNDESVIVYRKPYAPNRRDADFESKQTFRVGDRLTPLALPDYSLAVSEIFSLPSHSGFSPTDF